MDQPRGLTQRIKEAADKASLYLLSKEALAFDMASPRTLRRIDRALTARAVALELQEIASKAN